MSTQGDTAPQGGMRRGNGTRYVLLAVLAVADYTFLMDFFIPLPGSHSNPALAFRLHTVACGPPSAARRR